MTSLNADELTEPEEKDIGELMSRQHSFVDREGRKVIHLAIIDYL